MPQEEKTVIAPPRDTSGGHVLRVKLHCEYVNLAVECREPEGAMCRVICAADECERYGDPDHECGLKAACGCNAEDYLNNTSDVECGCITAEEIALHDGMPIEVSWDGDGYEWIPVDAPVTSDKL